MEQYPKFPYKLSNCPGRFYIKNKILGCSLCGIELSEQASRMRVNAGYEIVGKPDQFVLDVVHHFALKVEFIATNTTKSITKI